MADRPVALFAMSAQNLPYLFPPDVLARLRAVVDIDPALVVEDFSDPLIAPALARADILITGWGCPRIDAGTLAAAPRLRAVLHAAGSVKDLVSPAGWERGLIVSTAAAANALPVAEYTLGVILLAGKDVLGQRERYRAERGFPVAEVLHGIGNVGRRVGVVGASRIGRRVMELLSPFDFRVCLADPYVDAAEAAALGAELIGLDDLLKTSDIVTVHAPATDETAGLIGRRELALMPDGALLVNTARGVLVDTGALTAEVASGRLSCVLDVTDPEPLPVDSPLFDLPNAFLTPHIAGSQGNELLRMGSCVVDEAERLAAGQLLAHQVDRTALERAA